MNLEDYKNPSDEWVYRTTVNGVRSFTLSGMKYHRIKNTCTIGGSKQKANPSYVGCINRFTNFQSFVEWHRNQIGYGLYDDCGHIWQVEKDLLFRDNKIYSEDTCILLPQELNKFTTNHQRARGKYLIGVSKTKNSINPYTAKLNVFRKPIQNYFKTELEAFKWYKHTKETEAKRLSELWKPLIDQRAYTALFNYEVLITD